MLSFEPSRIDLHGAHLIEASAGTGKTYAITTLYLRLLLERKLTVGQILVVTFTEAATAELKERVRNRLCQGLDALDALERGQSVADPVLAELLQRRSRAESRLLLRLAIHGFDEAAIFTIHGFCLRMLRDSAFESGLAFDPELLLSQKALIQRIVGDFWVRERHDRFAFEVDYLNQKLSLSALRDLAAAAAEHPHILVLPARGQARQINQQIERHQALFLRLKEMWREHGAEVRDLLARAVAAKAVKRYTETVNEKTLQGLELFFAGGTLARLYLPDAVNKLTPGEMTPNKNGYVPQHVFFDTCSTFKDSHDQLEQCLIQLVERLKLDLVQEIWTKLPAFKQRENQLCFQDLLHNLDEALDGEHGALLRDLIRARFPAALVDEFQDTDAVQYRIFRRLFLHERGTLYLIGDPKQAIYRFRGADIFTYLTAADEVTRRYSMQINWRSDPGLIEAFNELYLAHRAPFLEERIGYPRVEARPGAVDMFHRGDERFAPLTFVQVRGTDELKLTADVLPRVLAARISNLLAGPSRIGEQALEPGHIAVLVRTNRQAQAVRNALSEYNIPCVLHGNISVFATDEADALLKILAAVAEPTRARQVKVALCTPLMGYSANHLVAMEEEPTEWAAHVKNFRRWRDLWLKYGFIQMFRALVSEAEIQRHVFASPDGERAMTNLLHLAELMQEAVKRDHLGPAGLLTWFTKQREVDLAEEVAYELRLESDARAVSVVTVHRSKGLEYPVVFCPYLWEFASNRSGNAYQLYHDPEHGGRVLDLRLEKSEEVQARVRREEFAENQRLMYVALTRARHYVEVIYGALTRSGESPLAYLALAQAGETALAEIADLHKSPELQARLAERLGAGRWAHWLEVTPDLHGQPWSRVEAPPQLNLPQYRRRLPPSRRNTSFSQLTSRTREPELLPARDYDAFAHTANTGLLPERAERVIPLREFPKGARAGTFFHSVLEHLDFTQEEPGRLERQVEAELRKAGFESRWSETLVPALRRILATPLLEREDLKLQAIAREHRLDELEFLFPIACAGAQGQLYCDQLAAVFESEAERFPKGYPALVRDLGFTPVRGYMKGFIDLVFRHGERWYLVDYKSNYLGPNFSDYAAAKLPAAMAESHYYLQYHVYAVALHRFLSQRMRHYAYERHFGGVFYLFIKGMDPELGPGYGVFRDLPPLRLIESLSRLLDPNLASLSLEGVR